MPNRPKVGEILLRAGVIDKFQLNAALGEQARWGRPLGATLVKLGFVEERDLVRALASQLGMPVASLDGKRIHPDVLNLVPRDIAERHMVIPLFVKQEGGADFLYVGLEDPGNLEVLDDLAFRTGMQVNPVMVSPSELWEGIDRYYRRELIETVTEIEADPPRETSADTSGTEELAQHWTLPDEEGGAKAPSAQAPTPELVPEETVNAAAAVAEPAREQAPDPGDVTQPVVEVAPQSPASAVQEEAPPAAAQAVSAEDKSRIILEALTQLLIEKGLMSRDELHQRIRELVQAPPERG